MKRWIAPMIVFASVLFVCPDAWAASPTEHLRGFFVSATRILYDAGTADGPEERLRAIRALVGDLFDFGEAARLSLGPDWSARTPAERAEFVRLFADFLERSFVFGLATRIRVADGLHVSYLGESIDGALATVRTAVVGRSGLELLLNYRMIERGDRWAVGDVVMDGVSLAANYRAQFTRVIQGSSYAELVQQMRTRVTGTPTTAPLATLPVADNRQAPPPAPARPLVAAARTETAARVEAAGRAQTREPAPRQLPLEPLAESRSHDAPAIARPAPPEPRPAPPEPLKAPVVTARIHAEPAALPPPTAAIDGAAIKAASESTAMPPLERAAEAVALAVTPSPAARAIAPATSRTARVGAYWVQVGAFADAGAARRLASLLREQEPTGPAERWVVVEAAAVARVRVGPFSGMTEAALKLRDLEARGYKAFIARDRD